MLVLYWGLRPLGALARAIAAVESGEAEELSGSYPKEVQPLTTNLNSLL